MPCHVDACQGIQSMLSTNATHHSKKHIYLRSHRKHCKDTKVQGNKEHTKSMNTYRLPSLYVNCFVSLDTFASGICQFQIHVQSTNYIYIIALITLKIERSNEMLL